VTDLAAVPRIAAPAPVVTGSVGVLGGTFDPIHHGHLAIAEEAREALGLERILFVPAAVSPFKTDAQAASAEHRLAMVEAAIAGNPSFSSTPIEIDRPGPSYTVDTLEALAADDVQPDRLWLVLSSEALAGLPRWRDPGRILDLARLAVVPRAGFDPLGDAWVASQFPGREDRFTMLSGPLLPISGSVIRRRAAAGRSVRYLVPDAVARYIAEHRLYREPA
jgi:nicotinate-nucleotide adenylyltransferase